MFRITLTCFSILFVISCAEHTKPIEIEQYTIDQFYKNKSIGGGQYSTDASQLLVSSNESGIFNVYALPVDGSSPIQLTKSSVESNFAVSFIPNSKNFIFSADKGGDENSRLYFSNGDGTEKDLTPFEKSSNSFYGWADDDQSFFFSSNKLDPRF